MACYGNTHEFIWSVSSTAPQEPQPDARCSCGQVEWKDRKNDPEALVADLVAWREELNLKYPTKLFFDLEFTGLHQRTTLISLGMVAESGEKFYAEAKDFAREQVDEWLHDNVIANLWSTIGMPAAPGVTYVHSRRSGIAIALRRWLEQFMAVEMWGDVLGYDWVLFCEVFGGARNLPANVFYIPFDLATKFKEYGIDPDVDRVEFSRQQIHGRLKHNALFDAEVIQACYNKLETPLPEFSTEMRWSS